LGKTCQLHHILYGIYRVSVNNENNIHCMKEQ
jgi:hypothetical protein